MTPFFIYTGSRALIETALAHAKASLLAHFLIVPVTMCLLDKTTNKGTGRRGVHDGHIMVVHHSIDAEYVAPSKVLAS